MRISDWSSDVCSSDLNVRVDLPVIADVGHALADMIRVWKERRHPRPDLGERWRRIDGWRATRRLDFPETDPAAIMPQRAIRALYPATKDRAPTDRKKRRGGKEGGRTCETRGST